MSFNVHNFITRCNQGLNPSFGEAINPYDKPRDINKFLNLFKKYSPDILCLQEVAPILNKDINKDITDYDYISKNFNFKYLCKKLKELGFEHKIIANNLKGERFVNENDSYYIVCNAIFSKHKIIDYKIKQFSFIKRNFIHANININGRDVDIINNT